MGFGRVSWDFDEELGVGLVDYVCYKNDQCFLEELRQWLGDEHFIEMLNRFAGSYIILPSSMKLLGMYYDYHSAIALKKMRIARKKCDLVELVKQETVLTSIAKKTKRKYGWLLMRSSIILKELEKTREWAKKIKMWRAKYLGGKNEK